MNVSRCFAFQRVAVVGVALAAVIGGCKEDMHRHSAYTPTESPTSVSRTTKLTGGQAIPATASPNLATGTLTVDLNTMLVFGDVAIDGLLATNVYVGEGVPGDAGSAIIFLRKSAPDSDTWTVPDCTYVSDAQLAAFLAGGLFFAAEGTSYSTAEIRGQLGLEVKFAVLNGSIPSLPERTAERATGVLIVNPESRAVSGNIHVIAMTAIAAQVEMLNSSFENIISLTESPAGSGVWHIPNGTTFDADQVSRLEAGQLYYSADGAPTANSKIRGQIGRVVRDVLASGYGAVAPYTAGTGYGTGRVSVDPETRAITGTLQAFGIPTLPMVSIAADIYAGEATVNGQIIIPLGTRSPTYSFQTWTIPESTVLTIDQYACLLAGNLYLAVHKVGSNAYLRGQINID